MASLLLVVLLTTLVSLFRSASTTSILLPLFVYPLEPNASSWAHLFTALSAHPSVDFIIIINPDSGPGAGTTPNIDYMYGIDKLHSYRNALVIGYVHCRVTPNDATRVPLETLESNITTYANWPKYTSGMNISVQGIFIDEAPNDPSSDSLQYMSSAAAFARNSIPGAYVVYNPGSPTSKDYFSPVPPDLSVQFEGIPSSWMGNTTVNMFAAGEVGRSAVLVHTEPSESDAQRIVEQCVADVVGAVYVTPDPFYGNLSYVNIVASTLDS